MKWLKNTKTGLTYISRMIHLLWGSDKVYFFIVISVIAVTTVFPFITMYLIKYSINMLTTGGDFMAYLPTVLTLLGVELGIHILECQVGFNNDIHGWMIGSKLFTSVFSKTMELNYEMLMDKDIMEKRERAMKVLEQQKFYSLTGQFILFSSSLLTICGIVYIVARIEFRILLLVLAIIAINSVFTSKRKLNDRKLFAAVVPVQRKTSYFMVNINPDTSFGKEIRLYDMRDGLLKVFQKLQELSKKSFKEGLSFYMVCNYVLYITNFLLNATIYGFLGFKVLVQRLITVGDFSLYLKAITTFNSSMQQMIAAYIAICDNGQYLKDYFDYIELKSHYEKTGQELPAKACNELVFTFENVSFHYPYQSEASLKNVNLTLSNRERLAIVGENGAGKTTLIKLLMRLFEPTEGRILLNGIDIREINYRQYLNLFASVFQDFKLFAFRIADNITSLHDGVVEGEKLTNPEKIRECLDKAGLLEKIESLDKGLDTYLYKLYEEDGVELSGGESQKLAIARALYKDAPVIILDEPTAALDPRAEYEIYTRFFEMVANKTSVFITHRLSSTRFCDQIIVLKNGSIVETGSHDELLARQGYYAELFNMQAQFYTDSKTAEPQVWV
ncbi:MAG: ABC transporter ATP-binding protein/permease [Treponema sp.]|jgi:ABC-type multidrug transport system fused ATPase/permease subunit|nr:ABC transporter ATP-binding protein/permease [Treponema sp.]